MREGQGWAGRGGCDGGVVRSDTLPQDVRVLKHREGVTYWSVEGRSILTAWTCREFEGHSLPLSEELVFSSQTASNQETTEQRGVGLAVGARAWR
jgi:hypothetical protein